MAKVEFGDRIREERERAGLTQPQLAKLVGVSARTIGNWERDEVETPRNSLTRLQDILPALRDVVQSAARPIGRANVGGGRQDAAFVTDSGEEAAKPGVTNEQLLQEIRALRQGAPLLTDASEGDMQLLIATAEQLPVERIRELQILARAMLGLPSGPSSRP